MRELKRLLTVDFLPSLGGAGGGSKLICLWNTPGTGKRHQLLNYAAAPYTGSNKNNLDLPKQEEPKTRLTPGVTCWRWVAVTRLSRGIFSLPVLAEEVPRSSRRNLKETLAAEFPARSDLPQNFGGRGENRKWAEGFWKKYQTSSSNLKFWCLTDWRWKN